MLEVIDVLDYFLRAVIEHNANSVDQTHHKLITLLVGLQGSDVVGGLLPVDHFSLVDVPNANHLVEASTGHVILCVRLEKNG